WDGGPSCHLTLSAGNSSNSSASFFVSWGGSPWTTAARGVQKARANTGNPGRMAKLLPVNGARPLRAPSRRVRGSVPPSRYGARRPGQARDARASGPSQLPDGLADLLHHGVVRPVAAPERKDRGGEQVRPPRRADQVEVFGDGYGEL